MNRITKVAVILLVIVICVALGIAYNRVQIDKWSPEPDLIGEWSASDYDFSLMVSEDGSVEGSVNGLLLEGEVKLNRTNFERKIKVKTDYIVKGHLYGYEGNDIDITLPFNMKDGVINGTLFHIESMKYPDPIVVHVSLEILQNN